MKYLIILLWSIRVFALPGFCYNNETKEYIGEMNLQIDPLETKKQGKVVYMFPPNVVTKKPPIFDDTKKYILWDGKGWVIKDLKQKVKHWWKNYCRREINTGRDEKNGYRKVG